ncbi:MAG: hypothetical protein HY788_03270 [Deltaproteobacteria bacterium]|nr:hypothetical protein [Deltaproteobacteria bacterium]
MSQTTREHVHELNEEIRFLAGGYVFEREGRIEKDGRQVLYAVGHAFVDRACCGTWGCRYAFVPGYMIRHQVRKNDRGLWVSEVEPIVDEETRHAIVRILKEKEYVQQVQFQEPDDRFDIKHG